MGNSPTKIKTRLEGAPVVLVIGAGYGGVSLAKALDSTFNVVLIDRKDYFLHNIGALRASVTPSYAHQIVVPLANLLTYGHVVKAEVMRLSPGGVYLHGRDEPLDFDYLVVATGTSYAFPCKIAAQSYQETPPLYEELAATIAAAGSIAIIGGGPTGCELCGEIREQFPDKRVTLIHARDELIGPPFKPAFGTMVRTKLEEMGVTVVLGDRVDMEASDLSAAKGHETNYMVGARTLKTRNGLELAVDLTFFCIGAKVNKGSYESDFASAMDESGRLRVNEFLQIEGYSNIFAMGDCTNVDEPKLGYAAQQQAQVLAKNLQALHAGKSLKPYVPSDPVMIVTLGAQGGVSQLRGKLLGNLFTRTVKAKGLFTSNQWSTMRLRQPKEGETVDLSAVVAGSADDDTQRLAQAMQVSEAEAAVLLDGLPASEREGAEYT